MQVVIDVTEDDIEEGSCNIWWCPIARAAKRVIAAHGFADHFCEVQPYRHDERVISIKQSNLGVDKLVATCMLPEEALKWAGSFDSWFANKIGERPKPFSFTASIELIG